LIRTCLQVGLGLLSGCAHHQQSASLKVDAAKATEVEAFRVIIEDRRQFGLSRRGLAFLQDTDEGKSRQAVVALA
jgi:hypothetical protein